MSRGTSNSLKSGRPTLQPGKGKKPPRVKDFEEYLQKLSLWGRPAPKRWAPQTRRQNARVHVCPSQSNLLAPCSIRGTSSLQMWHDRAGFTLNVARPHTRNSRLKAFQDAQNSTEDKNPMGSAEFGGKVNIMQLTSVEDVPKWYLYRKKVVV